MGIVTQKTDYFTIVKRSVHNVDKGDFSKAAIFGCISDLNAMFEIAAEILKSKDWAIYVLDSEDFSESDVRVWIKEMDLFVFAVSESFLDTSNPARTMVMKNVRDFGKRILPVKIENASSIGRKFSSLCGSIHLLDRTQAGYEAGLNSYLDDVADSYFEIGISSSDLRLMFDIFKCKAFLSYRKKDSDKLYRLLTFIRKIPDLRDMSIFYDSALVPGEDYNEMLAEKMNESDIVIFVITPNMLSENNYVIREEYPNAVKGGKILIPVLMADTDLNAVKETFPAFERVYDIRDFEELKNSLLNVRRKFGDIPEFSAHEKYILSKQFKKGLKTEKNNELAKSLLAEAMESGHVLAKAEYVYELLDEDRGKGKYLKETEERLWDAMMSTEEVLLRLNSQDHGSERVAYALQRLSDEMYMIAWNKEVREHEIIKKASVCLKEANDFLKAHGIVSARYGALPYLRLGAMYLSEGNVESADSCLEMAEKLIGTLSKATGNNIYLKVQLLNLHMYKGQLNVKYIKRGDKKAFNDVIYSWEELKNAMDMLTELGDFITSDDVPVILAKEIYYLVRLLEYVGQEDNANVMLDYLSQWLCGLGFFDSLPNRETLDPILTDGENIAKDLTYSSLEELKGKLDKYTDWCSVDSVGQGYEEMFSFSDGFVPEGVFGDVEGNFYVSKYKCLSDDTRLYKVVFPEGNDPEIRVNDKNHVFYPARVFVCPRCGRYFATPKGRKLTEGPVFMATPFLNKENQRGRSIYDLWWEFFDAIGDLYAERHE